MKAYDFTLNSRGRTVTLNAHTMMVCGALTMILLGPLAAYAAVEEYWNQSHGLVLLSVVPLFIIWELVSFTFLFYRPRSRYGR